MPSSKTSTNILNIKLIFNSVWLRSDPASSIIPDTVDSLTYASFESVSTIREDPYSETFVYNADNQRAKMEVKQSGSTILTRWYPTGSYIKETAGSATKEYTFIGGDAYTAPVVAITRNGTTTYYNLLRDHLGSITHVVNASNNALLYEYSYDSWGRMRNPATWVPFTPAQIAESNPFVAGRGFTGHEHLPWFSMINMNGRLYDPLTGQFLSPDKYIQDPGFTQSYNRYGYCLNNPLKYTDPSGYLRRPYSYEWNFSSNYVESWVNYQDNLIYGNSYGSYYYYNWKSGKYYHSSSGKTVSFYEVFYNYVVPNSYYHGEVNTGSYLNNLMTFSMTDGTIFNISLGISTGLSAPASHQSYGILTINIDDCGIDAYVLFPNRIEAQEYLKNNAWCNKEKFFYINKDKSVLVGPWNDATERRTSPRYADRFFNGFVSHDGRSHEVMYFVHTHP